MNNNILEVLRIIYRNFIDISDYQKIGYANNYINIHICIIQYTPVHIVIYSNKINNLKIIYPIISFEYEHNNNIFKSYYL